MLENKLKKSVQDLDDKLAEEVQNHQGADEVKTKSLKDLFEAIQNKRYSSGEFSRQEGLALVAQTKSVLKEFA